MTPLETVAAVNAALTLVETLLPAVQRLASGGEITVEEQQAVKARFESLRGRLEGQFSGPEWELHPS